MIRTKKIIIQNPDAILTTDWHLRISQPRCRTDDFWTTQWSKVDFVSDLQKKYDCPVLNAGDLFHESDANAYLLSTAMIHMPKKFRTIYGQHDLPNHNPGLAYKSALYALVVSGSVEITSGFDFGEDPDQSTRHVMIKGRKIMIWHKLVWTGEKPWPDCKEPEAERVLRKYSDFDLILTGDNHQPFVVRDGERLLVNPGSLTRQKSDQKDHRPRVYLWEAKTNRVQAVYIPIQSDVISDEHISKHDERDQRIKAFVERLTGKWNPEFDFQTNLEIFFRDNATHQRVIDIILKAMEGKNA
jgi:predicted phosphodiesterase